jgi:hypothetical protein
VLVSSERCLARTLLSRLTHAASLAAGGSVPCTAVELVVLFEAVALQVLCGVCFWGGRAGRRRGGGCANIYLERTPFPAAGMAHQ